MLTGSELCVELRIERRVLDHWITEGWLMPVIENGMHHYTDIDIARGRLILDLGDDLGVNDEGMGIILDLVDQIHGLRAALGLLEDARRPTAVRGRLSAARAAQRVSR